MIRLWLRGRVDRLVLWLCLPAVVRRLRKGEHDGINVYRDPEHPGLVMLQYIYGPVAFTLPFDPGGAWKLSLDLQRNAYRSEKRLPITKAISEFTTPSRN